jgi:hypothetical protein
MAFAMFSTRGSGPQFENVAEHRKSFLIFPIDLPNRAIWEKQMATLRFDAAETLNRACDELGVNLAALVAATTLWAHPETHFRQVRQYGYPAVYPGIRRLRPGQKEKRGIVNGSGLDDNTYANGLIKRSLGVHRSAFSGFECCHVWPNSCYDARYHTVIANLVLVPAAIASLTDHNPAIQAALQYRALELYRWYPKEQPAPVKPALYPTNWRDPEPDPLWQKIEPPAPVTPVPVSPTAGAAVDIGRLRLWAGKPTQNVYRIIDLMCDGPLSRRTLTQKIAALGISQNPGGAIASLMTNKGNAYGRVFIEQEEKLYLHPDIENVALRLWGRNGAVPP